jgi:hypothetical protein
MDRFRPADKGAAGFALVVHVGFILHDAASIAAGEVSEWTDFRGKINLEVA